jgi:hypothetical protein
MTGKIGENGRDAIAREPAAHDSDVCRESDWLLSPINECELYATADKL